ncbi:MAG: hypothetical protein JSV91_11165, partial [Phycisphaerales bacterium]
MRILFGLLATAAMGAAAAAMPAVEKEATAAWKLKGDLATVVQQAAPNELIPISIVMRDQVGIQEIQNLGRFADKYQQRAAVLGRLKEVSRTSSAPLLAVLQAEQATGAV